jgi:hypothetical protein
MFEPDVQLANDEQHIEFLRKHHHQQYRTKRNLENADHVPILFLLKYFDIVNRIPIDWMHDVCLGIMPSLLVRWTDVPKFKMTVQSQSKVSKRLISFRKFFPVEFQRKPESLDCLSSWKASQHRSFLLYTGVVALHGILDFEKLDHFYVLVTVMRLLVCRVSNIGDRDTILEKRAKEADVLIRFFIREAIRIYGVEIASIKLHLLLHLVEDYSRFGAIDSFSAFRFESTLGRIKTLVYAHNNPGSQIINAYSSLLQTGHFGKEGNRGVDALEEYFEEPVLKYPCNRVGNYFTDECAGGWSELDDEMSHQCYNRLYVKSFVLCTDNEADCYCAVRGNIFLKVREIVHNVTADRIFLRGNTFDNLESLYRVNVWDEEGADTMHASADVGILVGRLTNKRYDCEFGDILQKVCAIPMDEFDNSVPRSSADHNNVTNVYALLRFLH